jgi:hypothetical protein
LAIETVRGTQGRVGVMLTMFRVDTLQGCRSIPSGAATLSH